MANRCSLVIVPVLSWWIVAVLGFDLGLNLGAERGGCEARNETSE